VNPFIFRLFPLLVVLLFSVFSLAESPRVIKVGQPVDSRGKNLKTLNGHFPFVVPKDAQGWQSRSDFLRHRVLVATGLWPMPEKTPLNPVIHGKIERRGFTVEKVYFESLPGHFVTGMLFRPSAGDGNNQDASVRRPAVLSPHGHGGRLQRYNDKAMADQIAQGGEHFERSGRMPKLARCAQLARMGCVTFIFDMLGYADSNQISLTVAHRFKEASTETRSRTDSDAWGFYSLEADLRLQSVMGLQTWNAIRSLDFLASLPDVDPERLAVTGGSGGGTQTILLGAIDDRVKVGFPNGMVSTAMQGGCYCENCNLLRIDTGNVELAALFAPRPQGMTAANDWTKEMMTDGYPQLQQLYAMTGNRNDVYCRPMLHFNHNYNYVARATMYQWMNRHLNLGLGDPVVEQDYQPLTTEEMAVWTDDHPAPSEIGIEHERKVCAWFDQQASKGLNRTIGSGLNGMAGNGLNGMIGSAWQVIFDQGLPDSVEYEQVGSSDRDGVTIERGVVRVTSRKTQLPLLTVSKPGSNRHDVLIWTDELGKSTAFEEDGRLGNLLTKLVASGATVLLPDLYHQGELQVAGVSANQQPLIDDHRPFSAFTFCYNRTAVVQRASDLMAIIAHAVREQPRTIRLLGTGKAALWVAPVVAQTGKLIDRVAIDNGDCRFSDVESYHDVCFVPGAVKYGDLPALLSLRAPHKLTVISKHQTPPIVKRSYAESNHPTAIEWRSAANSSEAILAWSRQ